MKTEEDEAFDDLAKRQGSWGGGFQAKRQMAVDKLQDGKCKYCVDGCIACDALAQPAQEPAFKWRSVFQEMPAENSHIIFCFGVHIVEGSFTKNGWASLAYGTAQPDFWAYFPPPPHHKRNQELYAMPPKRPWAGLTDDEIALIHADYPHPQGFAKAIQNKLKEKNT